MMRLELAVFLALSFAIAAFQVALILGAPWGHLTLGGQVAGALPAAGRAFAVASLVVLALMAWAVAERAGAVRRILPRVAIWLVVGYLVLGVILHLMTPSPAERALWLPVIGVQLACALRIARG